MAIVPIDFAAGQTFASQGVSSGDIVEYTSGTWTITDGSTVSMTGVDNVIIRPESSSTLLTVDSYQTVTDNWTEVDPADGVTPLSSTGLWRNTDAAYHTRNMVIWPGARTTLLDSLTDANALTGAGFIANYRKNMGKFRRTNGVNTENPAAWVAADAPSLYGQWCSGDNTVTGLWIYTGNSNTPEQEFGTIYYGEAEVFKFTDCHNIIFEAAGMRFDSCGFAVFATTTDVAGPLVHKITINDLTVNHCYKAVLATGASAIVANEDVNSNFLSVDVNRATVRYSDGPPIHFKGHHKLSRVRNCDLQYVSLGDTIAGVYWKNLGGDAGTAGEVSDNTIRFVSYGNTFKDGFNIYLEAGGHDVHVRRNFLEWGRDGVHLGGAKGNETVEFNYIANCGQMVRVIDANGYNATQVVIANNTGREIDPTAHMPWEVNNPGQNIGAIGALNQIETATDDVDIHNNLVVASSGVTGQQSVGIWIKNDAIDWTETNNVLNGWDDALMSDEAAATLDSTSTETAQTFDDAEGARVSTAPAALNGVAIAGITDRKDQRGIPAWPTPSIGCVTVYPTFPTNGDL